ncbi:MAG: hypothetical protein Hens3KO_02740 [Henriciella sp.]
MFRFITLLLVLLGLSAAVYGAARYLGVAPQFGEAPSSTSTAVSESSSTPAPEMAEMTAPKMDFPSPRSMKPATQPALDDDVVSITSAGEGMLDRLRTVPIAHETPSNAKFGRPFQVTVAIDATGDTTAADALPGTGNIVEGEAQVSSKVMAALSGERFDIEPVTPMTQTVSPLTENVWRWRVTPTEVGGHELVIELFAMEGDDALPVRTFRDKVEVQVSQIGQIIATIDSVSPVTMVVGGIGSFLAGLIGLVRLFKRS